MRQRTKIHFLPSTAHGIEQSTVLHFQFLDHFPSSKLCHGDSKLMGGLPYHLRMSLWVLALLIFATKNNSNPSLELTVLGSERRRKRAPWAWERREEWERESWKCVLDLLFSKNNQTYTKTFNILNVNQAFKSFSTTPIKSYLSINQVTKYHITQSD